MDDGQLFVRNNGSSARLCKPQSVESTNFGLRVASIFIILAASMIGALMPVWLARSSKMNVPKQFFFVAKYFGSGVILATAYMHLLSPAEAELGDPCLVSIMGEYDWAMAIALITIMVMFLLELVVAKFGTGFGHTHGGPSEDVHGHGLHGHSHDSDPAKVERNDASINLPHTRQPSNVGAPAGTSSRNPSLKASSAASTNGTSSRILGLTDDVSCPPGGQDHLGHHRDHLEDDSHAVYAAQMTGLFILEFGVVFHSIFIGLTLAVTDDFVILLIVITFHQLFEGLGLGSRLATATWPAGARSATPWVMGMLYALSTPVAIAVGLGVKGGLAADPTKSLIVNGIFDSISAGILMYTALVELLAHEFMFNPEMHNAPFSTQMYAYACVATGCGLMSLLAKWA